MLLKKLLTLLVILTSSSMAFADNLPEVKSQISLILKNLNSRSGDPIQAEIVRKFWIATPYPERHPCVIDFFHSKKVTIRNQVTENFHHSYAFDLKRVQNLSALSPMGYTLQVNTEENRVQHIYEDNLRKEPRIYEMISEFRYDLTSDSAEKVLSLLYEAIHLCQ